MSSDKIAPVVRDLIGLITVVRDAEAADKAEILRAARDGSRPGAS